MNAHILAGSDVDEELADLSRSLARRLRRHGLVCSRIADLESEVDDWVYAAQLGGRQLRLPIPVAASGTFVVAVWDGSAQEALREVRLAEALRGPRCHDLGACRTSIYAGGAIRTVFTHPSAVPNA